MTHDQRWTVALARVARPHDGHDVTVGGAGRLASARRARMASRSSVRGAAMVEAICVIAVFILFFVGMVYFETLYHHKIRAAQLARAGTVAYAMDACKDASPTQYIQKDLASATGSGGNSAGQTGKIEQPKANVGNSGDQPIAQGLGSKGLLGDPISGVSVSAKASAESKAGLFGTPWGFHAEVGSSSFMSCGDPQGPGDVSDAFGFVKSAFGQ